MSPELLFALSLVLALVLGFVTKVNTGYYAILLAFINGVFVYGFAVKKIAGMWPIYLFLMLFIVTLFYGFAIANGTLVKVAEKIIYKSRNHPAALPFVLFFICMFFAGTGAGAPATFAFISPLVMTVCIRSGISRVLAVVLIFTGATIGSQFPFSVGGIIVAQVAESTVSPGMGSVYCLNVLANAFVSMTIFFLISYFILKGYKTPNVAIKEPAPFNAVQRKTLWIVLVVLCLIILPAVGKALLPGVSFIAALAKFCDVTVICAFGIILCLFFRVGNEKEAVSKIPFAIIIMVCSMGMLIELAVTAGLVDNLSAWVSRNVTSSVAPYILLSAAGIMSFFAATLGVVIPTLALLVPALADSTGVSTVLLFTLIAIGGFYTGSSPFSTCGAMALAGINDEQESQRLFKKLLLLPVASMIYLLTCLALGVLRVWV